MLFWMTQVGDLLQQYAAGPPQSPNATSPYPPDTVDDDFDQVAQAAPPQALSSGLADAFRSPQTPPFPQMLGQLFNQSNGQQRADLVNRLRSAAGPNVLSQAASRPTASPPAASWVEDDATPVTPDQAQHVPAQWVEDVATHAEQQDPSIIDQLSDFYAEQPALVKTLGGMALAVTLARISNSLSHR
jgi:hypothetical protein